MTINKNKTNYSNKTSKKLQMHTINLKNNIKYSCNKAKKNIPHENDTDDVAVDI